MDKTKLNKNHSRGLNMSVNTDDLLITNFVYALQDETNVWKSLGFKENKNFASYLWDYPNEYIIMTREPVKLIEYGKERLIGGEIVDVCPFLGTYGMGGPGYFGFKIKMQNEIVWLVVCILGAEAYMLLDDRVFYAETRYKDVFNPWYFTLEKFNKSFKKKLLKYKIVDFSFHNEHMTLHVEKDSIRRLIELCNNDERLSLMSDGSGRKNAFDAGNISDFLMVIYDGTNIFVE